MLSGPPRNYTAAPLSMPPTPHTYSRHHPPPPPQRHLPCNVVQCTMYMYMMSVPRAVKLPYRSPCRRLSPRVTAWARGQPLLQCRPLCNTHLACCRSERAWRHLTASSGAGHASQSRVAPGPPDGR